MHSMLPQRLKGEAKFRQGMAQAVPNDGDHGACVVHRDDAEHFEPADEILERRPLCSPNFQTLLGASRPP